MTMAAHTQADALAGATIAQRAPVARFSLRLRAANLASARQALGLALPDRVGAMAAAGAWRALCLGPDEWLIEGPENGRAELPAALPHALVDISDREIGFRIEGPRAAELLSIGIARDLAKIAVGSGLRTAFDSAQAVVIREGEDAYTLSVWRSYAPHVSALLAIGTAELNSGL
jgi:sarcosine oxidase subunit gamma